MSFAVPGHLIIKYHNAGSVQSFPLEAEDFPVIWKKDWTEKMRTELQGRFLFLNCVVNSKRGLERRPWRYLMSETRNVSVKQLKDIDEDSLEKSCRVSRQSLFMEKPMNAFDVNFELLHSGVASLPGTRDLRGGAILVIDASRPDWGNVAYTTVELTRLFMYFHIIPMKESRNLGFSVIIDARKSAAKRKYLEDIVEAMVCFQESTPGGVHMVYILAKKDSPLVLFSGSKVKEQLNFEFKLITTVDELKSYIDRTQLTPEFGGVFNYDHDEWIRFRIKLEPFMTGCRSAAKLAMGVMQQFTSSKLGENIQECKNLMEQHHQKIKDVFEDSRLSALQVEGEQILIRLQEDETTLPKVPDYIETVNCVTKLYHQMNEVFCKLEMLTDNRTRKLEQCLALKEFEEDLDEVVNWISTKGEQFLDKHTEIGDSIGHCYCDRVENLLEEGSSMVQGGHYEGIGIKERKRALDEIYRKFCKKLEHRRQELSSCMEFFQLVEQASEWSMATLTKMAMMNMEEILYLEGVTALTRALEKYLQETPVWSESRLNRISELATNLGSAKLVKIAENILTRYKEILDMLQKRQETLHRAEERLSGHPSSEASSTTTGGSDESTTSSPGREEDEGEDERDLGESEDEIDKPITHVEGVALGRRRSSSTTPTALYSWKETEMPVVEEIPELNPRTQEKLMYIFQEMIDTERDYVKSLQYIMDNYIIEMDNPELLPSLKGKKNILFGNIVRIHDFHKRYFLQELEACKDRFLDIGSCFLKWERQFYLYALYNKNKPRSDQLLSDHGNVYFRERQIELGDKLDLGSFLIKPVQRMGKYSLLLRDMIKALNAGHPKITELKAAEAMVKYQLRHGNDLLAWDSLRGCDMNVKEQGRLLRQDNFIVWNGKKKHQRRVFLQDDLVIFSKVRKQAGGVDLYYYKNSLKTSDLGLTENIGDSGLKFELWFRRRKKEDTFVLQAQSLEVKTAWVTEITRLLWKQAMRSREYGLTEASTGICVGSQPPLVIPSTLPGDTSPYQPVVNAINVPLMRTQSTPSSGFSPRSTNKRLSLASSETASSMDSSSSSGVCDLNLHETPITPLEEKLSKSSVKRNKVRKMSCDKSPLVHDSISKERLAEKLSSDGKETLSERRRSSVEETPGSKHGKDKLVTSEEDKKGNTFFKSFSFLDKLSERDRSRSTEDTVGESPGTRRSIMEKDINNTVPRRRSFIERISIKTHMENTSKRRNSLEMPNSKNGKGNEGDEGNRRRGKDKLQRSDEIHV
ncbi:Pleckstrin y domain containing, G (with RhoGef domain) member [Desmophyllum pertusum]|uniref:Pleckstrin y domain containing, G (With RhoGef domain) member n=1 Tax=Desmophyllum pertusum TaxID=174260 RepID=A0A9W9ZHN2_9CNID|nr:Pleckstrin y domain containing, G (with RhoGef domain) member [Desmophyllum pertusum]